MQAQVLKDICDERLCQDQQWGGEEYNDSHVYLDWQAYIQRQNKLLAQGFQPRETLVKIAALAVAAIESMDRKSFHV